MAGQAALGCQVIKWQRAESIALKKIIIFESEIGNFSQCQGIKNKNFRSKMRNFFAELGHTRVYDRGVLIVR
jgi:hypothetical protein